MFRKESGAIDMVSLIANYSRVLVCEELDRCYCSCDNDGRPRGRSQHGTLNASNYALCTQRIAD